MVRSVRLYVGKRIGMLVLKEDLGKIDGYRKWVVVCDCGTEKTLFATNISETRTKSCGCENRITPVDGMLTCRVCNEEKESADFISGNDKHFRSQCNQCRLAKVWAKQYNIDLKQAINLTKCKQYCEGCKATLELNLDHDHQTNRIRGFLCRACNTALGLLKDDINILQNLINYVDSDAVSQFKLWNEMDTGRKDDSDKLRWDLLPVKATKEIVKVLSIGSKKYGPNNWKLVMQGEGGKERYFAALMRHLMAWKDGEIYDPESGIHHLAHAACNALFLLQIECEDSKESSIETMMKAFESHE